MPEFELELVGRKGRDFFRRRPYPITGDHVGILNKPAYADASAIARKIIDRFENDEIDAVYIIYNEFKSVDVAEADGRQGSSGDMRPKANRSTISLSSRWSS